MNRKDLILDIIVLIAMVVALGFAIYMLYSDKETKPLMDTVMITQVAE